jgi:death-on-curing protein
MAIRFLTLARVLEMHAESIETYGGDPGVRDMSLLESALAQPRAGFGGAYLHDGLSAMAAAYLFHLVMNHPFVDGNKRTGALAAFVFLDMNGAAFDATEEEYQELVVGVAEGRIDKSAAIAFFQRHVGA